MRIRNLNTFVKIARLGSFHAAAQHLHATQPAISARITALENELGAQLFIRDKSGTRLSPRGVQLLPYAEKLIAISQEMKQQIREDAPEKGSLRIGIADTLAHLWLSPLLRHWQAQYPLMSFELISDVSPTLVKQLTNCQLDLALMVSDQNDIPELVSEPLCSYPQCWVAAPGLIGDASIHSVADLVNYPVLSFPRETRPWDYLQQLFQPFCEDAPVFHTCSSVASLLTMVAQGIGVALMPEPIVRQLLDEKQLVELNIDQAAPALSFNCSWRLDDDRILPQLLANSSREIMTDAIQTG